jgi:hypothetical protein
MPVLCTVSSSSSSSSVVVAVPQLRAGHSDSPISCHGDVRACRATGELDATQTVDRFIEYYYDSGSPLYRYSHKLPLLRQLDGEEGIEVIVTCGQDPCHPKMTGFIAWLVAGTFIFSAATTACVIMTCDHLRVRTTQIEILT